MVNIKIFRSLSPVSIIYIYIHIYIYIYIDIYRYNKNKQLSGSERAILVVVKAAKFFNIRAFIRHAHKTRPDKIFLGGIKKKKRI